LKQNDPKEEDINCQVETLTTTTLQQQLN